MRSNLNCAARNACSISFFSIVSGAERVQPGNFITFSADMLDSIDGVGPEADRVTAWIKEAEAGGASVIGGGRLTDTTP
jgi:hypothetical protein